ncbi:envelope lipids regulation factor [Corynebacterium resistens DSM 45100]|uniref:Envelope lipids regulation factor n=1 Tax=Corynebacterium resistens (strain DSM 45100 / JCM 12819 / GTC 2026 / SICGH 158) TaxID=662755 RepID=F8DYQ4_CORRG|nr:cutinase family protein [Corynebacterium resistens]AEI08896.1 envelope lipids regulation factor [Corynebacterium resistens DSM 45100]
MKKLLTIVAALVVVIVIAIGVGSWINSNNSGGPSKPGPKTPSRSAAPKQPENPPGCAPYELIAAPGTWESKADDDPVNPHAFKWSLLLQVTQPLQQQYSPEQLKVWTVPYTAQFRNINAQHEKTYDASRAEGYGKIANELKATHQQCPATKFLLVGFSQGAVIMGDMANNIGNGRGPVPADSVRGVSLIADGRQELDKGILVGDKKVNGVGAEIALNPVSGLIQGIVPGATMRGPRPDGFGGLNDRVFNICAVGDLVCDGPRDPVNAVSKAREMFLANPIHKEYAKNKNVLPGGATAPQWVVGWTKKIVDGG